MRLPIFPQGRGRAHAQAAFEYVLLLGILLALVVFSIAILKGAGPGGLGFQVNSSISQALPFINSSTINETIVTVNPIVVTPRPTTIPTPTVTPLPPARLVSSCRAITYPGLYRLSNDLESNSTCISIVARDVVLDCAGHSINGPGRSITGTSYGVYAVSVSNAAVKGCVINDYSSAAAFFDSCEFCSLENSTVTGSREGAWFKDSPNSVASSVSAAGNAVGFHFQHSSDFEATGNAAVGNGEGFRLDASSSGTLAGNLAANNSANGFYFVESSMNSIAGNVASGNGGDGFRLASYSNDNIFDGDNATLNSEYGFFFGPSAGNAALHIRSCGNVNNLACSQAILDGGNNTCGAPASALACLSSVFCGAC